MTRNSTIYRLGLTAFVAAGAACSLGFGTPAYAAADSVKSPRDSASGQATGKASFSDLSVMISLEKAMGDKITELETLLGTLQGQMDQLTELSSSAQSMGEAVEAEQAASAEASAEDMARLDEAKKAFDESVAGEIESEVADQVSASLEAAAAEAAAGAAAEPVTLTGDLESLSSLIGLLHEAIDELKTQEAAMKASYDLALAKKV